MMTAEFMLSKRPVLRFTAALFFLLKLFSSHIYFNPNSVSNVTLSNYKFFQNDSPSNAGGVGFCINDAIKCCLRNDLFLNLDKCEELWLEIECEDSIFILAVVYRHSNQDLTSFHNKFCN